MASSTVADAPSVPEPTTLRQDADVESSIGTTSSTDIEHVAVSDDPRQWSYARKVRVSYHALCNYPEAVQSVDHNFVHRVTGYNGVCISF